MREDWMGIVRDMYRKMMRAMYDSSGLRDPPPAIKIGGSMKEPHTTLWDRLAVEGRHELIERLRHVERHETGYGTMVVPKKGYSEDPRTHGAVLNWLRKQGVLVLNPALEIARMEEAL